MDRITVEFIGPVPLLTGPPCETCSGPTRLVGIEGHPRLKGTSIRTFECPPCSVMVALLSPPPSRQINAIVLVEQPVTIEKPDLN
jgi:hypothetical protein